MASTGLCVTPLLLLPLLLLAAPGRCVSEPEVPYPVLCNRDSEGCILNPANCLSLYRSSKEACGFIGTWRRVDGAIDIELGGRVGSERGYLALGFSPSWRMEEGIAVSCYKTDAEAPVVMKVGFFRSNKEFEFLPSELLADADSVPNFDVAKKYRGGFFTKHDSYGVLECRARLRLSNINDPRLRFLMEPEDPEVQVMGSMKPGVPLLTGGSGLKTPSWWYMTQPRPLSATNQKVAKESTGGAKTHGCLMVLAWVFFASVATLLARYYKLQWPSRMVRQEHAWFQLHRFLMAACCVCTVLSFIIIFVDLRGYSGLKEFPQLLHPILGIIVTVLTIANPLVALCRCHPTDNDRPWFNWIHWLIGTLAYVLAVLNLFIGLRLERAGRLTSIDYHVWLLIFFVLFQFVVEIVLEIHTLYHWRRNKKRWQQYRQDMQEYQSLRADAAVQQPKARPIEPRPAGYCLRTCLLVLHAVVAAAVAFVLIVVIIAY